MNEPEPKMNSRCLHNPEREDRICLEAFLGSAIFTALKDCVKHPFGRCISCRPNEVQDQDLKTALGDDRAGSSGLDQRPSGKVELSNFRLKMLLPRNARPHISAGIFRLSQICVAPINVKLMKEW